MKVAVAGCAHGELDKIYDELRRQESRCGKIELLICCGDFQSTRNEADLRCMSVPEKYYRMGSFYKYYSGEATAPVLTLFIGGNHEASNYLQELPYGGWVAPNIYYMGYAGVVKFANLRIAGLSGIYKPFHYHKGHFEKAPYDHGTKRSVYHVRSTEVFRLKQLSGDLDIMVSHDWPNGIHNHGDVQKLLRNKPFFQNDIDDQCLGSKPSEELLMHLKPKRWFAAHLHTRFEALVRHADGRQTEFLALDKCLPRRSFLEVVDFPDDGSPREIFHDLEWLTILNNTDHLTNWRNETRYVPNADSAERWSFTPTLEEMNKVLELLQNTTRVSPYLERSAPAHRADCRSPHRINIQQPVSVRNGYTTSLCATLQIRDPLFCLMDEIANDGQSFDSSMNDSFSQDMAFNEYPSFIDSGMESSFGLESPSPHNLSSARTKLSLPEPINSRKEDEMIEEASSITFMSDNSAVTLIDSDEMCLSSPVPEAKRPFRKRNRTIYEEQDSDDV